MSQPDLDQLLAACDRFVPQRMLQLIGADSIEQVQSGQHVERLIHILFTDIQGYTALAEDHSSTASFQFINSYLGAMEPVVQRNGGVVDKFIGDAIMALFPEDADDAVHCALELAVALDNFNASRAAQGQQPIRIGIGIHTGLVAIGAIGTEQRLEITVIGDSVNLAARLESTTREYGAQILVSENVLYALNRPQAPASRFVDRIRVKGKMRPVSIYEVFSPDTDTASAHKMATRAEFERAVAYYQILKVDQAREIFVRLCAQCPDDRPAQVYLERCHVFGETGQHHGTGEISREIEWSHDYDTGVNEIDEQHQEWCKRLAALFECLQSGQQQGLPALFDHLRSYIEWHFAQEEALMDQSGYPLRRQHKLEHARYAEVLERFKTEFEQGQHDPLLVTFRANLCLVDWFINHTTGTDRQLGVCAAEAFCLTSERGAQFIADLRRRRHLSGSIESPLVI